MKERPILFSGPMVRAILEGRKTQTRRVVKLPIKDPLTGCEVAGCEAQSLLRQGEEICPYGVPGDRLWVRETWGKFDDRIDHQRENLIYRASGEVSYQRWRPSIHMPRWASRILLEIEAVRVERLNDISAADAIAEGVFSDGQYNTDPPLPYPVATFKTLWESINGQGSWDLNPWVWVIQFRRVQP